MTVEAVSCAAAMTGGDVLLAHAVHIDARRHAEVLAVLVQEALEARIVADPRLGGLVIGAFVAQSELIEEFGRERRAIAAVVSWRTEV